MTLRTLQRWLIALTMLLSTASALATEPADLSVIVRFDRPFLFAYGTWEKRVRAENSVAFLDADGMTPKGGAGVNQNLDLTAHSQDCPGLRIKVGRRNTLKTLRLLLNDTAGRSGTWNFTLPVPGADTVVVISAGGASFDAPNEPGKTGPPGPGKIMQWQFMGDWGGDGAIDIQVEAILAVPPNDSIRGLRAERTRRAEEARVQAERDRQAARRQYGKRTADSPEIQAVYAAAPDIIALQIHSGKLTPCRLTDYKP
jgi:hypothetical protein